jgi:hypothetical protein
MKPERAGMGRAKFPASSSGHDFFVESAQVEVKRLIHPSCLGRTDA